MIRENDFRPEEGRDKIEGLKLDSHLQSYTDYGGKLAC